MPQHQYLASYMYILTLEEGFNEMLSSLEVERKDSRGNFIHFIYTEGVEASREMKMDLDPLLHGSVE